MAQSSRWLTWILEASAERQIPLPWTLLRQRKAVQGKSAQDRAEQAQQEPA